MIAEHSDFAHLKKINRDFSEFLPCFCSLLNQHVVAVVDTCNNDAISNN